uniref:DUF985 domain-containing protein n=1 Tax=Ectopseudomonas oleovorans TaxID=301 RepID=A0A653AXE7_ECTOL
MRQLIERLGLDAHPEGGFYRRLFVASQRDAQGRAASSAILFLLPGVSGESLAPGRCRWHFHEGDPLQLLIADAPGSPRCELLGPVEGEQLPQRAVPAHAWQAARSTGPTPWSAAAWHRSFSSPASACWPMISTHRRSGRSWWPSIPSCSDTPITAANTRLSPLGAPAS